MSHRRAPALAVLFLVVLTTLPCWAATSKDDGVRIKARIAGVRSLELVRTADGAYRYRVERRDGRIQFLTPDELAELIDRSYQGRPWVFSLLNISTWANVIWVAIGLLGQVLFSGRMIVQWLVSEKKRRSVVPVSFWWMSLVGATMLLVYFGWRRDIVGVLGQSTGWLIYVRNLWLIYRRPAVVQGR